MLLCSLLFSFKIVGNFDSEHKSLFDAASKLISKYVDTNTDMVVKMLDKEHEQTDFGFRFDGSVEITTLLTEDTVTTQYHAKVMSPKLMKTRLQYEPNRPDIVFHKIPNWTVNALVKYIFNAFGIVQVPFVDNYLADIGSATSVIKISPNHTYDEFINHPIPFVHPHFMSPPTYFQRFVVCDKMTMKDYFAQFQGKCYTSDSLQWMPAPIFHAMFQPQMKKFDLKITNKDACLSKLLFKVNETEIKLKNPILRLQFEYFLSEEFTFAGTEPTTELTRLETGVMSEQAHQLDSQDPALFILCNLGYAVKGKSCSPIKIKSIPSIGNSPPQCEMVELEKLELTADAVYLPAYTILLVLLIVFQ